MQKVEDDDYDDEDDDEATAAHEEVNRNLANIQSQTNL